MQYRRIPLQNSVRKLCLMSCRTAWHSLLRPCICLDLPISDQPWQLCTCFTHFTHTSHGSFRWTLSATFPFAADMCEAAGPDMRLQQQYISGLTVPVPLATSSKRSQLGVHTNANRGLSRLICCWANLSSWEFYLEDRQMRMH